MKLVGKKTNKCECCGKYDYNAYFFKWYSIVTKDYLCTICFKCARREMFGTKFKDNKRYEKWLKEIEK
jgi:hypothetical protein